MVSELMSLSAEEERQTRKIRVLLADDHPLLLQALRGVLEKEDDIEVVAEVNDGEQAVNLAAQLRPDIVIMDISMPKLNGLEATRQIKATNPEIAVLALTIHTDNEHILSMLQAGAAGYLTKGVYGQQVVSAVRAVTSGEAVLSPQALREILKYASQRLIEPQNLDTGDKLTAREVEILTLVAKGLSNKDIACRLGLSLRTVKGHLTDLFLKLNVASRTEAVIVGLQKGILSLDALE